jgi:hypothetical protein
MTWPSRCDRNLAISNDVNGDIRLSHIESSRKSHSLSLSYRTVVLGMAAVGATSETYVAAKVSSPPYSSGRTVLGKVRKGA